MGIWQEFIDVAKPLAQKVSVGLDFIAKPLSEWITIPQTNVHQFLVLILSIWLAETFGRNRFSLTYWIALVGSFMLFRYLGL